MLLITGGWQPPNTSAHALVDGSEVWLFRSRFMQAFGNSRTLAATPTLTEETMTARNQFNRLLQPAKSSSEEQ